LEQKIDEVFFSNSWILYLDAMKSPLTRYKYQGNLARFLDFAGIQGITLEDRAEKFAEHGKKEAEWAFQNILRFIHSQKKRVEQKQISAATVRNYVKSIKLFCEMAYISVPWKKITRGLAHVKRYADDRVPTIEEIRKLVEYPDRRIKAIVYIMASSGIRLGAWDFLKWGHLTPIERKGKIEATKIIVYEGEDEQYFSFISSEAWQAVSGWMEYRKQSGEKISEHSWVMRNLWDAREAQGRGLATKPMKLSSLGIKRLMERAIWAQGLRKKLEPGKKRHPYQTNHSLRKWFKTRCEVAGTRSINIEMLMGHSIGVSSSYCRPTDNELLEDYLKALPLLTIGDEHRLQERVNELSEKAKDNDYNVRTKLQEKEEQISLLVKKQERFERLIQSLIDSGQMKGVT
jgi:integrase